MLAVLYSTLKHMKRKLHKNLLLPSVAESLNNISAYLLVESNNASISCLLNKYLIKIQSLQYYYLNLLSNAFKNADGLAYTFVLLAISAIARKLRISKDIGIVTKLRRHLAQLHWGTRSFS